MTDLTPLPNPSCGAISPDGDTCPSDSAATIASEWPTTGYATVIWRCHQHIGASVETALHLSPQSIITVTPLTAIDDPTEDTDHTNEPNPDPPTETQPSLRLVR